MAGGLSIPEDLVTAAPDYAQVQATLSANLLRCGALDSAIAREDLPEWATVLSDIACTPLAARIQSLESALAAMLTATRINWRGQLVGDLQAARAQAEAVMAEAGAPPP